MKKQLLLGMVLAAMSLLPSTLFAQSTQGTDFWVTLMSGDRGKNGDGQGFTTLSLTFAAKDSTWVWITNGYANNNSTWSDKDGWIDSVKVGNDTINRYNLNSVWEY